MAFRHSDGAPAAPCPHVALLPTAGMGHLMPFCRLAVALADLGCHVSVLAVHPAASLAESRLLADVFSSHPGIIRPLDFHLPNLGSDAAGGGDPFFARFGLLSRLAADHIPSLLTSSANSPPITAVVLDLLLAEGLVPVVRRLGLPCYFLSTSSARLLAFAAYLPKFLESNNLSDVEGGVTIPGVLEVPRASILPPLFDPNHPHRVTFLGGLRTLPAFDGVLFNSFDALEPNELAALNAGAVTPDFPRVFAVGPLQPLTPSAAANTDTPPAFQWLDKQPPRSVIYVSFGSRTAMSAEQIKELAAGLESSGCRFFWVLKTKVLDKDEDAGVEELLGKGFLERVKEKGRVVNSWVDQSDVLRHHAIGAFLSHCGWNSVGEAAMFGMPILAWPRMGDQRINAEVVRRSGLGLWVPEWSWEADRSVVGADEIAAKVREVIGDEALRASAAKIREAAVAALAPGGSSERALSEFLTRLKM